MLLASQKKLFEPVTLVVPLKYVTCPLVPVPVTGLVKAFCLLLKVVQSALDKAPLLVALAVGRLKVCVAVELAMLKSVPLVPVAKNCTCLVKLFNEVNPLEKVVITWHKWLFSVCKVTVLPSTFAYILIAILSVIVKTVAVTGTAK